MKCLVAYEEAATPELRWIFGYQWSDADKIDALLERVRYGNFNALCVSVRGVADAFYESSYEPMNPSIPEGFDPLAYLVQKAHDTSGGKAYIEVHPLVLVYRVLTTDTPPPGHVLDLHPEWISENYDGEQVIVAGNTRMYMDQAVPEVQDYLMNVFMEIINYDIDGFNLDFIRYREQDCGYNPIALSYFHQFTGRSDRPAIDDPEWSDWRREQVTNFVKRMYANVLKVKPHIVLSMDGITWEVPEQIKENNNFWWNTYQDWPGWLEKHYIDLVLGMAYRTESTPGMAKEFDDWHAYLRNARGDREAAAIVGAYINPVQDSLIQLHRVRQTGCPVMSVFAEGSSTNNQGLPPEKFHEAVRSQLFPTAVPVPECGWKSNVTTGVVMGRLFVDGTPCARGVPGRRF